MDDFSIQQRFTADAFRNGMAAYRNEPLLLYGFGRNTEAILRLCEGFSIAGLLGPTRTEGTLYGKPILSLEQAAKQSRRIVIVASEASRPIIYRRIRAFAESHGIAVHDFMGNLMQETPDGYDRSGLAYWKASAAELRQEIERHDVISFDIFDTLLGRYVLRPRDVFAWMEQEIRAGTGADVPFEKLRTEAEQDCPYGADLYDIYHRLQAQGIAAEDCRKWRERELECERRLTFPKPEVVEIFRYALSLRKPVFLTSDMYIPKAELLGILTLHGITGFTDLLVSCTEKAQKSDGKLFQKLLARNPGKRILHIGDHPFHDVEAARQSGIDAFRLWSGYDLFQVSSLSGLLVERMPDLGDRLALGLLCAKLFSDPFALHETKGRVTLTTPEPLGYCFIGPWALGFLQWAAEQFRLHQIEQAIYPSRDAYLFYRIGTILQEEGGYLEGVEQVYLKASRRAASFAAVHCMEDLKMALRSRRFRGTNGEMLREWFRTEPDEADGAQYLQAGSVEDCIAYLSRYQTQILAETEWERRNYRKYLRAKGLTGTKRAAVFDFVSGGTVQYYLERLLRKPMLGLYCGTISHPNEMFPETGHVLPAFGNSDTYRSGKLLFKVREMMECILVDGDNMLAYMDENGEPVFFESACSYEQALRVQESSCAFVREYLRLFGRQRITLAGAEKILGALFQRSCSVQKPVLNLFSSDCYDEALPGENIFSVID